MIFSRLKSCLFCAALIFKSSLVAQETENSRQHHLYELYVMYDLECKRPSDIYEHIPILRDLAKECNSLVDIGLCSMLPTWGFLQGLSESESPYRSYLGISLCSPSAELLNCASLIAYKENINFDFWQIDDMNIDIDSTDLLFIDSLHTYCHLTYQLEKFSPQVRKYIVMHDTSAPWGEMDEPFDPANYCLYPAWIDKTKRGLWAAVEDFLSRHPEWTLVERRLNNHGLTILRRK